MIKLKFVAVNNSSPEPEDVEIELHKFSRILVATSKFLAPEG
jgi:hypothetical protein